MNELKKFMRGVEGLRKDMEELGVEVKVSVSIDIPHISLYSAKPKETAKTEEM